MQLNFKEVSRYLHNGSGMSIQADKGPLSAPLPVPFHKNFLVLIIVIKEKEKKVQEAMTGKGGAMSYLSCLKMLYGDL